MTDETPDYSISGYGETPIDVTRPFIRNPDGSTSTESSFTEKVGDRWLNFASIVNGRRHTDAEAMDLFRAGLNPPLGAWRTRPEAEKAAAERSARINRIRRPDRSNATADFIRQQEGYKPDASGRFPVVQAPEPGQNVGHGHKIQDHELESGKIHGIPWRNGLSVEEAEYILRADIEQNVRDMGLEDRGEGIQLVLTDLAFRMGPDAKKTKIFKALSKNRPDWDEAYAQMGDVHWTDRDGNRNFYDKRNSELMARVGYEPTQTSGARYRANQSASAARARPAHPTHVAEAPSQEAASRLFRSYHG